MPQSSADEAEHHRGSRWFLFICEICGICGSLPVSWGRMAEGIDVTDWGRLTRDLSLRNIGRELCRSDCSGQPREKQLLALYREHAAADLDF